jgi:hypothetical protein
MRQTTLNRIRNLERILTPGKDAIERIMLKLRFAVAAEDLQSCAQLESRPELERTPSEQALVERCEQAYIETFSAWTTN